MTKKQMIKMIGIFRKIIGCFMIFITLFTLVSALNIVPVYASENNDDFEDTYAPYDELSPILDKHLYEHGELIEIKFVLDSQYNLVNITYEIQGFDLIATPAFHSGSSSISVFLKHTIDYIDDMNVIDTEAQFTLFAEVIDGNVFDSKIYGYSTINGVQISQYHVEKQDVISEEMTSNNSNKTSAFSSAVVHVGGKIRWQDSSGVFHALRRVKVEFIYASKLDDETFMPLGMYYTYTNNNGDYNFSLTNPLNLDVALRVYAEGRKVELEGDDDYNYNCVTVYENGGLLRHWREISYLSNPNGTYTRNLDMQNNIDTTRGFEICQAVLSGADYAYEMGGTNAPGVSVNYPSGIADNTSAAGYFASRILIPSGLIDWDTVLHEYGHHIGWNWGIDFHPAQNLEIIIDWPPTIPFDYHWSLSMFDAPEGAKYSKSQNIRLSWAEAWAEFFSKMVRHYYKQNLDGITATGIRAFNISDDISRPLVEYGEASIYSIEAVLWRIYRDILNDGRNIENINNPNHQDFQSIKKTHKTIWDAIINSQTIVDNTRKSFSSFANYFITKSQYSQYRSEFGRILAIHGMSPRTFVSSSYTVSSPPAFSWQKAYDSAKYPINRYELVFYNSEGKETLRKDIGNPTTLSYALPLSDWQKIINDSGDYIYAHILAYQTNSNSPTGGFISEAFIMTTKYLPFTASITNGKATITGVKPGEILLGSVEIPSTILISNAIYPVTAIASSALANQVFCEEFIIPNSITSIGNQAFKNCIGLTSITIPNSVTSIGDSTFSGCSSLTNIILPTSITQLGEFSFSDCTQLSQIEIPSSVKTIGQSAFEGCTKLSTIQIPSSVTKIDANAFRDCSVLIIYPGVISKPSGWVSSWNSSNRPVLWGGHEPQLFNDSITLPNYNYPSEYNNFNPISQYITSQLGHQIETNRLRCGVIGYAGKSYLTLSAKNKDSTKAYLEYYFTEYLIKIDYQLALWSSDESLVQNSSIRLEVLYENQWISIRTFSASSMSQNKDLLLDYSTVLNEPTKAFRFIVETNQVNNDNNKGRVVIGDISVLETEDNHVHNYTQQYFPIPHSGKFPTNKHIAYCDCGAHREENCLGKIAENSKAYCIYCGRDMTGGLGQITNRIILPTGLILVSDEIITLDDIILASNYLKLDYSLLDYQNIVSRYFVSKQKLIDECILYEKNNKSSN